MRLTCLLGETGETGETGPLSRLVRLGVWYVPRKGWCWKRHIRRHIDGCDGSPARFLRVGRRSDEGRTKVGPGCGGVPRGP